VVPLLLVESDPPPLWGKSFLGKLERMEGPLLAISGPGGPALLLIVPFPKLRTHHSRH
jgi:hypothetical protein